MALAEAGGAVVTREQLRSAVWQRNYISDEVITVAVRALRKALDDDAQSPAYIQTFPGQGYRLVCDVGPMEKSGIPRAFLLAASALILVFALVTYNAADNPAALPLIDIPENAVLLAGPMPEMAAADREAFVRARYVVRHGDTRQMQAAEQVFDDLILRYPGEAGLMLAAANARLLKFQVSGLQRQYLDEAGPLLERVAEIGLSSSAALGAMAVVRYYRDWDVPGADALFREALEADNADTPDLSTRRRYARFLGDQQRFEEAWRVLTVVAAPDPRSFYATDEARLLYFEGRYAEAIINLEALLKARATPGGVNWLIALNLEALGRYDDAMEAVIRYYELRAYDAGFIDILRRSYADGGWQGVNAHFRDFYIGLRARGVPQSPVRIARHALGAGDQEEAIARLRKAMEDRDPAILSISVDPVFRALRGVAVFDQLVVQVQGSTGG